MGVINPLRVGGAVPSPVHEHRVSAVVRRLLSEGYKATPFPNTRRRAWLAIRGDECHVVIGYRTHKTSPQTLRRAYAGFDAVVPVRLGPIATPLDGNAITAALDALRHESFRTVDLKGRCPDAIAWRNGQVAAVEVLGTQSSGAKWTHSGKRRAYAMFDDVIIEVFQRRENVPPKLDAILAALQAEEPFQRDAIRRSIFRVRGYMGDTTLGNYAAYVFHHCCQPTDRPGYYTIRRNP
jgi:hypothetical protein